MSIMSFLNTIYDTAQHKQRSGGPQTLIQGDSRYDYNTLRYPLDIGNYDKGHYMVIHINQQNTSQFRVGPYANEDPTVIANMKKLVEKRGQVNLGGVFDTSRDAFKTATNTFYKSEYGSNIANSVQNYVNDSFLGRGLDFVNRSVNNLQQQFPGTNSFISGGIGEFKSGVKNINGVNFVRTIKRTTDSITLYMPNTLNFQYNQSYEDLNLPILGMLGAGTALYDQLKQGNMEAAGKNIIPFLASGLGQGFGQYGRALTAAGFGVVENPMIELLYSRPNLRNFQFDFMLYPRDEKEALEVQKILERLRFHQAPEIKTNTGGYFLIPPSEFDIKFYYNGQINPNIDPISTCVLEQIVVNYSPQGRFAAYESVNQGKPTLGSTGMPVVIQLTLMFKETQIMTKDNFNQISRYPENQPLTTIPKSETFKVDINNPQAKNILSDQEIQKIEENLDRNFLVDINDRLSTVSKLD